VRSRAFKAQAHRQSLAIAESAQAEVDQQFVDAISERD
jgi:antidote-toxin recognition MazE-like antitoxin